VEGRVGNGDARISNKQLNYIVTLGKELKLNPKDLDSVKTHRVKMDFLNAESRLGLSFLTSFPLLLSRSSKVFFDLVSIYPRFGRLHPSSWFKLFANLLT